MSDGGKGSKPRPFSVTQEEFGSRIDAIFGKKAPREPYVFKPEMLEGSIRITSEGTKQQFISGEWTDIAE